MNKAKFCLLAISLVTLNIALIPIQSTETRVYISSIGSLPNRTAESLHISGDGNYILVGTFSPSDSYANLFKVPESFTGDLSDFQIVEIEYDTTQKLIDINNDGSSFIVMSYVENKVYYQINSSTVAKWVDQWSNPVYDVKISGDGKYAIYTGHTAIGMRTKLVYTDNGSEIWHFDNNNILVCDISFDGQKSIVGAWNGTLWCFDKSSNETLWKFTDPNLGLVYHLGISGDGSTAFIADSLSEYIYLVDVDSGDLLWSGSIEPSFSDVEISYDGNEVLVITKYGYSAGNRILLFPRDSMTAQWEVHINANSGYGGITDDGSLAVVADENGNMMFIDCLTGSLLNNHTISDGLAYAVISPSGNTAAALTYNGLIYTYKIDFSSLITDNGNQDLFDPFLNSSNYPALGITVVLGILAGLLIGRLKRN